MEAMEGYKYMQAEIPPLQFISLTTKSWQLKEYITAIILHIYIKTYILLVIINVCVIIR